jgi:uncharacterized membrane protein
MSAGRFGLMVAGVVAYGAISWWVATYLGEGKNFVSCLFLLQHVGFHLALGIVFALTLRGPALSLIGRVAHQMHSHFTLAMAAYTRKVTVAWVLYFFGMAAVSLLIYAFARWPTWSLLANIVTPAAIATLLIGEYLLRYQLHPEFERVSLLDALRAYRRDGLATR